MDSAVDPEYCLVFSIRYVSLTTPVRSVVSMIVSTEYPLCVYTSIACIVI